MNLEGYLDYLQKSESIFPMDSFSSPRRKKVIKKYIYPKKLSEQKKFKKRVLIDFDGPIHRFSKGVQDGSLYDIPSEGVKRSIDWFKKNGFEIVIFTSRASKQTAKEVGDSHEKQVSKVKDYLEKHNIHYDLITAEKLAADFYIDDLAIHFNNWGSVMREVNKRMNLGG